VGLFLRNGKTKMAATVRNVAVGKPIYHIWREGDSIVLSTGSSGDVHQGSLARMCFLG